MKVRGGCAFCGSKLGVLVDEGGTVPATYVFACLSVARVEGERVEWIRRPCGCASRGEEAKAYDVMQALMLMVRLAKDGTLDVREVVKVIEEFETGEI